MVDDMEGTHVGLAGAVGTIRGGADGRGPCGIAGVVVDVRGAVATEAVGKMPAGGAVAVVVVAVVAVSANLSRPGDGPDDPRSPHRDGATAACTTSATSAIEISPASAVCGRPPLDRDIARTPKTSATAAIATTIVWAVMGLGDIVRSDCVLLRPATQSVR